MQLCFYSFRVCSRSIFAWYLWSKGLLCCSCEWYQERRSKN